MSMENAASTALRNIPRYVRLGQKASWGVRNAVDSVVDAAKGRTFYSHLYHDPQPQTILHITSEADLNNVALACDSDYGGSSRIDLDISPDLGNGAERWAVLKGRISLAVRKEVEGRVRGGWVGFRTIKAPADPFFMTPTRDIQFLTHLSVLVRPKGDPHLWPHWFVNIKHAATYENSDINTHRLGITGSGNLGDGWEECLVPLSNLAHLRSGEITESQLQPNLERMTTIGFSLLGAPRKSLDRRSAVDAFKDVHSPYGLEGNFHLDLGPVRAVYQQIHFNTSGAPPIYRFPPSLAYFQAQIEPPPPLPPVPYPSFKDSYYRDALQPTYERGSYPPYEGLPGVVGTYVEGQRIEDGKGTHEGGSTSAGEKWRSRRKASLSPQETRAALDKL